MGDKWDAIIVGGGIGGCAAGALLAKQGKKVLLLEKANYIGGRCWSGEYKGVTLDLGGHLIEDGAIEAVYKYLDKELKVGPPGEGMLLWKDGKWTSIRELYKDARDDLRRIYNEIYDMDWLEIDELDDMGIEDWLRQRTDSEGIVELFGNFGVLDFNVFTYNDVAASETLYLRKLALMDRGMIGWSQYPIGGFKNLVKPFADFITENGGEVRTGVEVSEIVIKDGVVKGVDINLPMTMPEGYEFPPYEFIEAPTVICTVPMWHVLKVIPENKMPAWYVDNIKRLKDHPDCWFGFYAVVTKPLMGRTTNGWLKAPRTGLPGWCLEPSAYDPSLCPEGQHLVAFGASVEDRVDWLDDRVWLKQKMKEFEADTEEFFPELKNCLWKKWYVTKDFALLQKPGYVGRHRPRVKVPLVNSLYCVSDTFRTRGMGVDASTRAAIAAVEDILGKEIPEFKNIYRVKVK